MTQRQRTRGVQLVEMSLTRLRPGGGRHSHRLHARDDTLQGSQQISVISHDDVFLTVPAAHGSQSPSL